MNDLKINLENTQRVVAEKIIIAGKVPLLERDVEDLKTKIKRYEDNSQKLLEELNSLTIERNKLLSKVDSIMKNPQIVNINKSRIGNSLKSTRSAVGNSDFNTISHGILKIFLIYKYNVNYLL